MKTLGMAILLALTSASFVMALGPWNSDTAQGAGELEAQGRTGGLMMRWEPPSTLPEEPLTGYQLRHRPQTTSQTPTWTTVDVGVVTSYRVTGLRDGTTHDVEVATRTAQGVGTFYASTTGTPGASQCESGTAVSDPANNSGLVEDCETLLGLKSELAGTATLNWSASTPVTSWEGVRVSRSLSRVTSLYLRYNQLTGSIPVELGQLSNLTQLNLNGNQLTGSIPAELGQLNNLHHLSLDYNQLTGSIPVELGQLSNLTSLDLGSNGLTGSIPAELGQLSNLSTLHLGRNQLTGSIPAELGQLSNLTLLYLSRNQLTGSIPAELGQLSNLTFLYLSRNQLTGSIPVELGQLSNLSTLHLGSNGLTGSIPVELGQLSNLSTLYLGYNGLTGSIPVELGQLSNLTSWHLYNNRLTGSIPVELGQLSNLTSLDLSSNELTGRIPGELGGLTNLTALHLGDNRLTSSIPAQLAQLTDLSVLDLAPNELTGWIPVGLGQLSNLRVLSLASNRLEGSIPVELAQLTNLSVLNLAYNELTGSIPAELGGLSNLRGLSLDGNQLTGLIPTELGRLSILARLRLGGNELTGPIPVELEGLAELRDLDLEDNQLSGSIPDGLGILESLTTTRLTGNQFTGCLPPGLRQLEHDGPTAIALADCPLVTISAATSPVGEGTSASFTVTRAGGTLSDPLTIGLSVTESGDTVSGVAPSSVTIPANQVNADVTIATANDTTDETNSVITVAITRDSSYARGSEASADVTVADDDLPTVTIAANGSPVDEGANASFTLTRTGDTTASLVVPVGVAETGATITGTPPASVTIPAGQTSVNVTVATEDDTDPESDSVITATLSASTLYDLGHDSSAEVTVQDDDPLVSFMAPDDIIEGENAVFTFERVGGVSHELVVSVSVLSTGDFLSGTAPTTVTFTADSTTADLTIDTVDDSIPEVDGSIAVLLRQGTNPHFSITDTLPRITTVRDNDRPTVTIAAVTTPVDEGGIAIFRVTATGGVIVEALTVPVTVSDTMVNAGTPPPTSVTLPATQRSVDISIPIEDHTDLESDRVITATLSDGPLYDLGDDFSATVTVTVRDDDPLVSFMAPEAITEGENAVFTFERVGGVSHELEVSVSVLPTGDFFAGPAPDSVTFAAGSTTADLTIDTVDDSTPEADGSIAVLLRQGVDYNVTGTLLQQVSVQDNDRSTVTITALASPVDEGNAAVFRVTRTGGTITEALTVAVAVTETGSMISGTAPTSLTIAANQTSADLSVPTYEDKTAEVDSVVTATLSGGSTYDLGTTASAAVTVTDDDLPALTITFDDTSPIEEGTTASFTVTRTGVTSEALTINVSVLETGNMIAGTPPTTLVFAANEATADLDIDTDDDSVDEPDSTIFVGVTLPNERRSRTPPDLVSVVVTDND